MDPIISDFLKYARVAIRDVCPKICDAARAVTREATTKSDGSLVTAMDKAVEQLLADRFAIELPNVPVLGEESLPDLSLADSREVTHYYKSFMDSSHQIVIDPIDGTRNFVEGNPIFCVAISITMRVSGGIWPCAGVVAIPQDGMMYWCDDKAVYREDISVGHPEAVERIPQSPRVVSVSSKDRRWLASHNYSLQCPWVSSGSSVYDLLGAALGRLHGSVIGSQRLWDLMAPLAIAERLGLVLRDLCSGETVRVIGPGELSVDFQKRPWGLMRRMALLPADSSIKELVSES